MVLGIIFWAFSFLRFQAEMGILLAFWMTVSMLGGLILLPAYGRDLQTQICDAIQKRSN